MEDHNNGHCQSNSDINHWKDLKSKIISTHLIIRKYQEKCAEFEEIKSLKLKLENDCIKYETDLREALQDLQPTKKVNSELQKLTQKQEEIIKAYEDKLKAAEVLNRQYSELVKTGEKEKSKEYSQLEKDLAQKIKSLENVKGKNKKLQDDVRKTTCKLKKTESTHRKAFKTLVKLGQRLTKSKSLSRTDSELINTYKTLLEKPGGHISNDSNSENETETTNDGEKLENLLNSSFSDTPEANPTAEPPTDLNVSSSLSDFEAVEDTVTKQDLKMTQSSNIDTIPQIEAPDLPSLSKPASNPVTEPKENEVTQPIRAADHNYYSQNDDQYVSPGRDKSSLSTSETTNFNCIPAFNVTEILSTSSPVRNDSGKELDKVQTAVLIKESGNCSKDLSANVPHIIIGNPEGKTVDSVLEMSFPALVENCVTFDSTIEKSGGNVSLPALDNPSEVDASNEKSLLDFEKEQIEVGLLPITERTDLMECEAQNDICISSTAELPTGTTEPNMDVMAEPEMIETEGTQSEEKTEDTKHEVKIFGNGQDTKELAQTDVKETDPSEAREAMQHSSTISCNEFIVPVPSISKELGQSKPVVLSNVAIFTTTGIIPVEDDFRIATKRLTKITSRMRRRSEVARAVSPLPPSPPISPISTSPAFELPQGQPEGGSRLTEQFNTKSVIFDELFGSDSEETIFKKPFQHQDSEGFEPEQSVTQTLCANPESVPHANDCRIETNTISVQTSPTYLDQGKSYPHSVSNTTSREIPVNNDRLGYADGNTKTTNKKDYDSVPNSRLEADLSHDTQTGHYCISIRLPDMSRASTSLHFELDTSTNEFILDYGTKKNSSNPGSSHHKSDIQNRNQSQFKSPNEKPRSDGIFEFPAPPPAAPNTRNPRFGLIQKTRSGLSSLASKKCLPPKRLISQSSCEVNRSHLTNEIGSFVIPTLNKKIQLAPRNPFRKKAILVDPIENIKSGPSNEVSNVTNIEEANCTEFKSKKRPLNDIQSSQNNSEEQEPIADDCESVHVPKKRIFIAPPVKALPHPVKSSVHSAKSKNTDLCVSGPQTELPTEMNFTVPAPSKKRIAYEPKSKTNVLLPENSNKSINNNDLSQNHPPGVTKINEATTLNNPPPLAIEKPQSSSIAEKDIPLSPYDATLLPEHQAEELCIDSPDYTVRNMFILMKKPFQKNPAIEKVLNNLHKLDGTKQCESKIAQDVHSNLSNPTIVPSKETFVEASIVFILRCKKNPFIGAMKNNHSPLTSFESSFTAIIFHLEGNRYLLKGVVRNFKETVNVLVFSKKDNTLLGLSAVCRVFAAICRHDRDIQMARILVLNLLKSKPKQALFLVANILSVWPDVLFPERKDEPTTLQKIIVNLLMTLPNEINSTLRRYADKVLMDHCSSSCSITFELDTNEIIKPLLSKLTETRSPQESFETNCCFELLSLKKGCEWCLDIVKNQLGPLLQELPSHTKEVSINIINLTSLLIKACPVLFSSHFRNVLKCFVESLNSNVDMAIKELLVFNLVHLEHYLDETLNSLFESSLSRIEETLSQNFQTMLLCAKKNRLLSSCK